MLGGLALFLYGMHLMGEGLSKETGGRLEKILDRLAGAPVKSVLTGAGITAVAQSSSAVTVLAVGLVDSGLLGLDQAAGIIMGANIGTTSTAWLTALAGTSKFAGKFAGLRRMPEPVAFAPFIAVPGVLFLLFCRHRGKGRLLYIPVGLAMLLFGMDAMCKAAEPLARIPEFTGMLTRFSGPLPAFAAGILVTAVIQSSSASLGILQALCTGKGISYGMVIPIILGQNIGTCVTALLSCAGGGKNAKKAACIHLSFNVIGTVLFMGGFYSLNILCPYSFLDEPADCFGIACVHSIFNIAAALFMMPFLILSAKTACCVPGKDGEKHGFRKGRSQIGKCSF